MTKQNEEHEPAPPHANRHSEEVKEAAEEEHKCARVKCTDV